MYLYIVDTVAQDKKYERELLQIQTRLQDLGIQGRFEKLTILKSIKGIVEDAVRKGVKTLVAVGNDKTFNEMITYLKNSSVTLGLIPFGDEHNSIADSLGIPHGLAACTTLSKRIIKKLDVGKVNGRFFFSSLTFPFSENMNIQCDNAFSIKSTPGTNMSVVNFCDPIHTGNAQDGHLETVISESDQGGFFSFFSKRKSATTTVVPAKKISIKSTGENIPIYSEGALVVKTPVQIEVAPKKLRIIAGA